MLLLENIILVALISTTASSTSFDKLIRMGRQLDDAFSVPQQVSFNSFPSVPQPLLQNQQQRDLQNLVSSLLSLWNYYHCIVHCQSNSEGPSFGIDFKIRRNCSGSFLIGTGGNKASWSSCQHLPLLNWFVFASFTQYLRRRKWNCGQKIPAINGRAWGVCCVHSFVKKTSWSRGGYF